jgi:hypothetical protein
MKEMLSQRIRPTVEAAPWVVDEVQALEAELAATLARAAAAERHAATQTKAHLDSVMWIYNEKIKPLEADRDAALARAAAAEEQAALANGTMESMDATLCYRANLIAALTEDVHSLRKLIQQYHGVDHPFICGHVEGTELGTLPEQIVVCPAMGSDVTAVYRRVTPASGPEY